jgi:hypothetical protein
LAGAGRTGICARGHANGQALSHAPRTAAAAPRQAGGDRWAGPGSTAGFITASSLAIDRGYVAGGYDLLAAGGHAGTADEALRQKAWLDWVMDSKPHAMTDKRAAPKATVMAADQYLLGIVSALFREGGLLPTQVTV